MQSIITKVKKDFDTPGSLYKLESVINQNSIDIDTMGILSTLPTYIKNLKQDEESIFKAYFWRQMSVSNICQSYCFSSKEYVFEILAKSISSYIALLKRDFGIKR